MTVAGGLEGAGFAGKFNACRAKALLVAKIREANVSITECFMVFTTGAPCAGREQAWLDAGRKVKEFDEGKGKKKTYFGLGANTIHISLE